MPRPGPNVTSDADTQPGSDSLFPTGFSGGGALVRQGSVGTGEIADGSVAAADLNLPSVAAALAARSEFNGTYGQESIGVRLRRAAARAEAQNAGNLPVMAVPPTITVNSSNPDATVTKTYRTRTDGIAQFRFNGGTPAPAGGAFTNFYVAPVVTMPSGTGGNTSGDVTTNCYQWGVEWVSDAPQVLIRQTSAASPYMLEIDGQPVSGTGLVANAGGGTSFIVVSHDSGSATIVAATGVFTTSAAHGLNPGDQVQIGTVTTTTGVTAGITYYVLAVPSSTTFTLSATLGGAALTLTGDGSVAAVRLVKTRRYRLEYSLAKGFDGVLVDPRFSVWAPQDEIGVKVTVVGDSIETGTGSTLPHGGWSKVAGKMLGWVDVRQVAFGGTGFINNATTLNTFGSAQRIADAVATNPDMLIIPASQNDDAYTASQVTAAALATFQSYRTALPKALILVMGADPSSSGPSAARLATEAAVLAAFTAWGDSNSRYMAVSAAADGSWFSGTGTESARAGTGNRDRYGFDSSHPNDAGHKHRARRFASRFRKDVLPTLP